MFLSASAVLCADIIGKHTELCAWSEPRLGAFCVEFACSNVHGHCGNWPFPLAVTDNGWN